MSLISLSAPYRKIDQAVEYYFTNNMASQVKRATNVSAAKAQQLYNQFKGASDASWDFESIDKFYTALSVDAESDIVSVYILMLMKPEDTSAIKVSEFT